MKTSQGLRALLARQWQRRGCLARLLLPLSMLTAWAVARKHAHYQSGRKTAYRAPVPVVVIGNIYVGGTGKTPMVIATVQALRARGFTPGVISRGYGVRIGATPHVGQGTLSATAFGDEPTLIAQACNAPIAVHPKRALAAQALLRAYPAIDVIVSDDGLQHLALARDIEIVMQDTRGLGNAWLLPAGPLREPPSRLHSVDKVIDHVATASDLSPLSPASCTDRVRMWLEPGPARRLEDGATRTLASFAQQSKVAAAAGIGDPKRFFATLQRAGITLHQTLALPDHYRYAVSPFATMQAESILITAKDAIKCTALHDPRLWEVPVQAAFSDPHLFDWLAQALRSAKTALP